MLEVRNIDFSYGQLQVLFDVSLAVHRGEALALLGTNGAGKSTLLRVISGLETPSAGSVTFAGRDITGAAAERLATEGLALIPGGRGVFTDMTVAETGEGVTTGGQFWRVAQFMPDCDCWRVIQPEFKRGF